MVTVLSNAKSSNSIDGLIDLAKEKGIKSIELKMDYDSLLTLEGMHGSKELNRLKDKLANSDVKLYGFCLYTSFNMHEDVMLAKKSINLLNDLGGQSLRLIHNITPHPQIMGQKLGMPAGFLASVARYASYSAGGGKGETTIRIGFDLFTQSEWGVEEIFMLNNAVKAKNTGIAVSMENVLNQQTYKTILQQANGYDLNIHCASLQADCKKIEIEQFIQEISHSSDAPLIIEALDSAVNLDEIVSLAEKYKFDDEFFDYTKASYMSSVARVFRKLGDIDIFPKEDIVAGSIGTWEYTFTVGNLGIAKGGGLKLCFHHSTNWEAFQLENASLTGYVSVKAVSKAKISTRLIDHDACRFIQVIVDEGQMIEGEKIIITIGDTTNGCVGSRAQKFRQKDFRFYTLVDAAGYGYYFQQPDSPNFNIVGDKASKITVLAPSVVRIGEPFDIGVRVEDQYGNEASGYSSRLLLKIEDQNVQYSAYEIIDNNPAVVRFKNVKLDSAGSYTFEVCDQKGLSGYSNYTVCTEDRNIEKVYWGDIHGHLSYMDSVGTTDEYYHYARNISFLDFTSHSEHMDSFSGERQATCNVQWEIVKQGTRKYHESGKFVTLLGYENSEIWDANVYFPTDEAPWHVDSYANRLFSFAKKHNAIVIPHMTTYPQRLRGYDWSNYDASVMPVVEIYSTHGSSEYFGGERPLGNCEPGGYVVEALNRGHKLGFIGSSDGHDCMPGNSVFGSYMNGLIAVYASELTREAIFEAIRRRRCYATTNARILGYFNIDGQVSGSEINAEKDQKLTINASFYGTNEIDKAVVVKDGQIIHTVIGQGRILTFDFEDDCNTLGHHYYYVKMIQKDGEMVWISPIFVNILRTHYLQSNAES